MILPSHQLISLPALLRPSVAPSGRGHRSFFDALHTAVLPLIKRFVVGRKPGESSGCFRSSAVSTSRARTGQAHGVD